MTDHNAGVKKQTPKQSVSKSPIYGYRKPTYDGFHTWCNCAVPNLVSPINKGMAYCLRCGHDWYI